MNWLFKKTFSWFEFVCIILIGILLKLSFWWLLLTIPLVALTILLETYCEIKEKVK